MTGSPLCEPASPQLDSDRRGRSYVLSWMLVASETHADRSERPRPVGALLQENASVRTGSSKDDRKRVDGGISGDEPAARPVRTTGERSCAQRRRPYRQWASS